MYNHAPEDYLCPFCLLVQGVESPDVWSVQDDIVYRDRTVTAFISSHQWPNNHGNVIVVPNEHFENIYDLPNQYALNIHRVAKRIALAMKMIYSCDGVSTRQHNEPAGNQDVWHYHLHVFPRYTGDELYPRHAEYRLTTPDERLSYAEKLRAHFYGPNPPSPLPHL